MPRRKGAVDRATWRALSLACATRDNFRCVVCLRHPARGVQAHHIVPRSQGGPDRLENLVSVCVEHHRIMDAGGWKGWRAQFEAYTRRASQAARG